MAAKKKAAPKKAAKKAAAPTAVKPTAAATAKDKEEKAHVFRVDLGESLPAQAPFPTGTDTAK